MAISTGIVASTPQAVESDRSHANRSASHDAIGAEERRNRVGGGRSGSSGPRGSARGGAGRPQAEVVKTWAFDSVGNRKYALQIRKASNGNPCIKIVEGVPQPDGTFRKFDLTIWSEDWPRLFEHLDTLRAFVKENNIRTPDGHKFDPNKKPQWRGRKK